MLVRERGDEGVVPESPARIENYTFSNLRFEHFTLINF